MNLEQATKLTNELILKRFGRPLRDVEVTILKGAWVGQTYQQIGTTGPYSADYLRNDAGPKFWKVLSESLGQKVGKKGFRTALEGAWRSHLSSSLRLSGVLSEVSHESSTIDNYYLPAEIIYEERSSLSLYNPLEDLAGADLRGFNFSGANFSTRDLSRADLSGANLSGANLSGANLSRTQVLNTNFKDAIFTGACIEDWNINSHTNLDDVICDYVYLREGQQERRPIHGNFVPGEFTKLCQKALETADLIFRNGIDQAVFIASIQQIKVNSAGSDLSIESIENDNDGTFVIRVNPPPALSKEEIEEFLKQVYDMKLKALEDMYLFQLKTKDEQLEFCQGENSKLISSLARMGENAVKTVEQIAYSTQASFGAGISGNTEKPFVRASFEAGVSSYREQKNYTELIKPQREVDELTVTSAKELVYKYYKDSWIGHRLFIPLNSSSFVDFIIENPAGHLTSVAVEFSRESIPIARIGELISALRASRVALNVITSIIVLVSDDKNLVDQWKLSLTDKYLN
jgi:uncharacterized protein YjbI with pentapeptide repeats